jgi:hypothetical protein
MSQALGALTQPRSPLTDREEVGGMEAAVEGGRGWGVNEDEWLTLRAPHRLLEYICRISSHRKARLYSVACCYRVRDQFTNERSHRAVELSELYADKLVPFSELRGVYADSPAAPPTGEPYCAWWCARLGKVMGPRMAAGFAVDEATIWGKRSLDTEHAAQAELLRDIFGNPFRPVTFDPHWRTSDVVGLAHAIYEDKAFERMPILADALMDAGCEEEQIIGHCRGDGPHVRGCWVVDLILDKQ